LVNIHTHPNILKTKYGYKYTPPSKLDYKETLHEHGTNRDSLIISPDGLWKIKPNDKLINFFKQEVKTFPHDSQWKQSIGEGGMFPQIKGMTRNDTDNYKKFMETLTHNTNLEHARLSRGYELKEYCEKNDYKYPMCKQITLDEYIKYINTGVLEYDLGYGFDIKLLRWDESWTFKYPKRKRDDNILEDMKSRNKLINKNINFVELKKCIDGTNPGYIVKCN